MQTHSIITNNTIPIEDGLCILFGYGIKVNVAGNHLRCQDGIGKDRRDAYFHRATSGLRRLAILSTDGYVSLGALQWLQDTKAGIIAIGDNAEVVLAHSGPGADYPQLRRAQAIAAFTQTGLEISRELIKAKIRKQAEVIASITNAPMKLLDYVQQVDGCKDATEIQVVEANAALQYWKQWAGVSLTFARKEQNKVPAHWLTFGDRRSPVSNDARKAGNPANALLNYAYAILEGETDLAVLTLGLDPGLGFMHTDQQSSRGLVYDLMEVGRPDVDLWLYRFLQKMIFTHGDFWETERGETRLSIHIRRMLTQNASEFSKAVGPWAEFVTQRLTSSPMPTLLTQSNRSRGRETYRTRIPAALVQKIVATSRCISCGKPTKKGRLHCRACWAELQPEQTRRLSASGSKKLRELRESAADPSHGGEAAMKRGDRNREHVLANKKWENAEFGELGRDRF